MTLHGLPILYALFLWWFGTGAILYLDGLPRRSFGWSFAGGTLSAAAAMLGLLQSRSDVSIGGAYMGFGCGLMLWAWLELGYYMGFLVGPRRCADPRGYEGKGAGWRRFLHAWETTARHEALALVLALGLAAVTAHSPNRIGLWTFLVLWIMQLSAKFNVFLGVANLAETLLPEHLKFLQVYMTRKPMNLFFPVAVTAGVVLEVLLVQGATAADAGPVQAAGLSMIAALTGLAILEHWFLVVPLDVVALWSWGLGSRNSVAERDDTSALPMIVRPEPPAAHRSASPGLAAP